MTRILKNEGTSEQMATQTLPKIRRFLVVESGAIGRQIRMNAAGLPHPLLAAQYEKGHDCPTSGRGWHRDDPDGQGVGHLMVSEAVYDG